MYVGDMADTTSEKCLASGVSMPDCHPKQLAVMCLACESNLDRCGVQLVCPLVNMWSAELQEYISDKYLLSFCIERGRKESLQHLAAN